jgi:hypothetical protein
MKNLTLFFLFILLFKQLTFSWSFAALGDMMWFHDRYEKTLKEVRDHTTNPAPAFGDAEFIVEVGDLSPYNLNLSRFNTVFGSNKPGHFPVRGNHDNDNAYESRGSDGKDLTNMINLVKAQSNATMRS